MQLTKFEIWHNYSYYLNKEIDLLLTARKIAESGIARTVFHSDGIAFWQENNELRQADLEINDDFDSMIMNIGILPIKDSYIAESLYQAISLRSYEEKILSNLFNQNHPYIRAFLGICLFQVEDRYTLLYPELKVYKNGIIILLFRVLSPKGICNLDDFIRYDLNLFQHKSLNVFIPPVILRLDSKEKLLRKSSSIFNRIRRNSVWQRCDKLINNSTKKDQFGAFDFEICDINILENTEENEVVLIDFWDMQHIILTAFMNILNGMRNGIGYLFWGAGKENYKLGNFFSGRPEVNIISFDKQPQTASEILEKYEPEIKKILTRTNVKPNEILMKIGKSLRAFDDMLVFVNEGIGLCIYSKKGIVKNEPIKDGNRNHLVFPHQVRAEVTNYLYASFNQLIERSEIECKTIDDVNFTRVRLYALDRDLNRISNYGEINEYFNTAWRFLGINRMRQIIIDNMAIKREKANYTEHKRILVFGWAISIIFGVTGFTEYIVDPIYTKYSNGLLSTSILQKPILYSISIVVILTPLLVIWSISKFNRYLKR